MRIIYITIAALVLCVPQSTETENACYYTGQTATTTPEQPTPAPELTGELRRICACESTGKPDGTPTQYEADGVTVRTGRVNPRDKGICQINLDWHEAAATALGYDLMTKAGNIGYAKYLYAREGSAPWVWSASCWSR